MSLADRSPRIRPLAFALCALATVAMLGLGRPALAATVHDVPVPGRVQKDSPGLHSARMGFRRTVAYYRRWLKSRGLKHEAVAVYRYRRTLVARFLSRETASRWSAIHVWHYEGRTWITIVPSLTNPVESGKSSPPRSK